MRKVKAIIEIEVESPEVSKAISDSVASDNLTAPKGLKVKTVAKGEKVVSTVECRKTLETFLATVEDLLAAIQTAQKTLKVIQPERRS